MCVMLDTNVLVSLLLFPNTSYTQALSVAGL